MARVLSARAWLLAHPDAGGEAVWSIAVEAQLTPGQLICRYALRGDLARVVVPFAGAGNRADGLWRHTCFEAFITVPGAPGYYEFNFSPALDWAAYRFDDYRTGMTPATLARAPELKVRRTADELDLTATVPFAGLSSLGTAAQLRLALAAVIEEQDGRLACWALRHAAGNPDFHHPEGFALALEAE